MKKIKVHGCVMLKGLKDGKTYLLHEATHVNYGAIYWILNPKTQKSIAGHIKSHVDLWIKPMGIQNNFIELINS